MLKSLLNVIISAGNRAVSCMDRTPMSRRAVRNFISPYILPYDGVTTTYPAIERIAALAMLEGAAQLHL